MKHTIIKTMKAICTIVILLILPLFTTAQTTEQDHFNNIVKAIKNGQVTELSTYLAPSVEYEILGQSNVYSKAQTIQVLKDFFAQNKAKSFSILHQSGKNQIKYIIGSYSTLTGKIYRITCFIKQEGASYLIQQIRIEDEVKNAGL